MENNINVNNEEIEALISDLHYAYGYDFTGYSRASFKRRVIRIISVDRLGSLTALRNKIISNREYFQRFMEMVTVNVTEMFRDPEFYLALRNNILNELATFPFIRIWYAGCSTGEEVYSTAILLKEHNLYHKSILYATDINPQVIKMAKEGIFPLRNMQTYSENYINAGGKKDFSSYYTAKYDRAKFNENLKSNIIFSTHNLVSDSSFNEFQLIFCRNVLIYFEKGLQDKVLHLFDQSIATSGFLTLGTKETIKFSSIANNYRQISPVQKIWKKIT